MENTMTEANFWATVRTRFPDARILQWDTGKRLVLKCDEDLSPDKIDYMIDLLIKVVGDNPPGPLVVVTPTSVTWHIGKETTPLEYALGQRIRQLESALRANHIPIPSEAVE